MLTESVGTMKICLCFFDFKCLFYPKEPKKKKDYCRIRNPAIIPKELKY